MTLRQQDKIILQEGAGADKAFVELLNQERQKLKSIDETFKSEEFTLVDS